MAVPKYDELYSTVLTVLRDGEIHAVKDIYADAARLLSLSENDLAALLPSGKENVFRNRLGWAETYLKKAGMIEAPQRGRFRITDAGRRLLAEGGVITNARLTSLSPEFSQFYHAAGDKPAQLSIPAPANEPELPQETPEETLERVYSSLNHQLADELLTEIMQQSPAFFERLVVDLMRSMNYGDGFVTKISGDGGIDGIIPEDKLGFSQIYIQAKRWDPAAAILKPEIQKFAGAMMGPPRVEKGLFITTARFSQGAQEYARAQHIILIDGEKLTSLMIEYGLGVSVQQTFHIKRIDSDYFTEA